MKVILYIAPHLSTGGLPQYLAKKIELLKETYSIYVIEYEDLTGNVLVVQRDRIRNLIGDRLITLPFGSDKSEVLTHIQSINPDIIHFEEMPEYFMGREIAELIYTPERTYKIFETSHDSSFDCSRKIFSPDKFVLVSNYQVGMLESLGIPSTVIEYPIEEKTRPDRTEALNKLGLDPAYKHVLHVGLFTPRKNQREFFEYAKGFVGEKVMFHSVGNMADNFKHYWEPLLADKPDNVIVHGEKANVDDYYAAMDLFLFTSRGTVNDKETMPLVIREAISWQMPIMIYNLPVYLNYFDKFENISYLDFDSFSENESKLSNFLIPRKQRTAVIISTYPVNQNITDLTLRSITAAKEHGYDVILTSHAKVPEVLQERVKYVVYDSNNILTFHDYYSTFWSETSAYKVQMNLRTEDNHIYHGPAVYTNYYNGISLAQCLGYDSVICFNFDMVIKDDNVYKTLTRELGRHKAVFNYNKADEGDTLRTVLFATQTDFFLKNFTPIPNEDAYTDWKIRVGSESNGLENMFYHQLKSQLKHIKILGNDEFFGLLKDCNIDQCSRVEYFNVLAVENHPNKFAVWFSTSNAVDNRDVKIEVVHDTERYIKRIDLKQNTHFYNTFDFKNGRYVIKLTENRVVTKTIVLDSNYMAKLTNNGTLTDYSL